MGGGEGGREAGRQGGREGVQHTLSVSVTMRVHKGQTSHIVFPSHFSLLCVPLPCPGQNKTFSQTLMFREVRTGELVAAEITQIRSTDNISLSLLEELVVPVTREEGQ